MSYDIQPYRSGSPVASRDVRRAGRAVSRHRADEVVAVSAVDTEADIAIAKIEAATAVTGQTLGAVVKVAQVQKHLELMAPEASERLNLVAMDHAWAVREMAQDSYRRMRRH